MSAKQPIAFRRGHPADGPSPPNQNAETESPTRSNWLWVVAVLVLGALIGISAASYYSTLDTQRPHRNAGSAIENATTSTTNVAANSSEEALSWYGPLIAWKKAVDQNLAVLAQGNRELRATTEDQARFLQAPYGMPLWVWLAWGPIVSLIAIVLALQRRRP